METLKEFYFYVKLPKDSLNGATLENSSVNPRTYYYLKLFSDFESKLKDKLKWNWFAAFFGMFWLAYRKIYKLAILYFIIFTVTCMITEFWLNYFFNTFSEEEISGLALIVIYSISFLMMGFFGNRIYFNSICSKIKKNIPPPQQTVSIFAIIWMYILSFMFSVGIGVIIEVIKRIMARF